MHFPSLNHVEQCTFVESDIVSFFHIHFFKCEFVKSDKQSSDITNNLNTQPDPAIILHKGDF